jgi:tetratricopeptide (TPR) repeat protein
MHLRLLLVLAAIPASSWAETSPGVTETLANANRLFNEHSYGAAKTAFQNVLKLDPNNGEANWRLGLYACDAGEWEKALAYEALALDLNPNSAKYQYGWGAANGVAALKSGLFSKFGYAKKCLAGYRRAVELEPSNAMYHFALFSYYQLAPGFVGGDMDLAREQAEALRKLDPVLAREAWARWYLAEKKPDQAFGEYEAALREQPDDYFALYCFGVVSVTTGLRLDDGIASFRRCLTLKVPSGRPSYADVRCKIATLYEKKNDRAGARTEYLAALKENPNYGQAKQGLKKLGPE